MTWTWYPELISRETFLAKVHEGVEERLVEAEEEMGTNLGFVKRTPPQRSGDEDDFQRHFRWFIRFQVAGEKEGEIGDPDTIAETLDAKAEELGLRKRTDVERKKKSDIVILNNKRVEEMEATHRWERHWTQQQKSSDEGGHE